MLLLGWLTFPLAYRLLPGLADRGMAFARTLGLLLWGYIFWLLASLGLVHNDLGGLLLALVVVLILGLWALRLEGPGAVLAWLRAHLRLVLGLESLFVLAFAAMGLVRAANPEILGTEKPMELAFINAILHSPTFPPHDPWLSGYAISYYYFGYVMVAMLAKLTSTPGGIAFNLGVVLVFALSASGVYGLVYNLLARLPAGRKNGGDVKATAYAWLGPLIVLLSGNLEGFLEVLHARGIFWQSDAAGRLTSSFWRWLDIRELSDPPNLPFSWMPTRYLWWWRASRVLQDYDFAGNWKEIIDEFPAFSYLLADLHPHVLAMPFAFLAMALALNVFLGGAQGRIDWLRRRLSLRTWAWLALFLMFAGVAGLSLGLSVLQLRLLVLGLLSLAVGGFALAPILPLVRITGLRVLANERDSKRELGWPLFLSTPFFLLSSLTLGGLGFLNTWDFPFYVALFSAAYAVWRVRGEGHRWLEWAREFIRMAVTLVIGGVVLYLPFYLSFSSQAGGVLPNLVYPTRGAHLWVMFTPLWLPILAFLCLLWRENRQVVRLRLGIWMTLGLMLGLWLLSILLAVGISALPGVGNLFLSSLGAPGLAPLLQESLVRRLLNPGGWITLWGLLGTSMALFISAVESGQKERMSSRPVALLESASPNSFGLLLILLGGLLVLAPEFFFLRDLFGWRMNTIFKFYYQAWLLWGIAAAYGAAVLLQSLQGLWGVLYRLGFSLLLGLGLTYTVLGVWTKTNGFEPAFGWTLDGTAHLARQNADEMAAIAWLSTAPPGVVAEAVGGSYTIYGRVSTLSGQPTVLGWDFHEVQWRGSGKELGSRQGDVQRLYCTRDWQEARQILQQYHIRYVYIGTLERSTYTPEACGGGLYEAKFRRYLTTVFQQGAVVIYAVP